jgi:hypothetical protein
MTRRRSGSLYLKYRGDPGPEFTLPASRRNVSSPPRRAAFRSPGRQPYGSRNWKGPAKGRAMIVLALFGGMLMLLAAAPGLIVLALVMVCLV